ncbi:MAG: S-layer homology domain-containing protein [Clostridia bacterium]|nr:S-layer homology domain-containing protein [Clostridia bacterium]
MKKVFSLILTILMLAGAAASVFADDSSFSDVKITRWSYEAIQYAVKKGYMNGVGDGKFDPAGSMTRGMVVTVLYRREGSPEVTFRDDFSDVKAGKYYSDAVIWAKDEGVVNGVTETTFEPNGKITREQLATMLSRFSERCPVSVPDRADLSGYPDADQIHNYAKDALGWANEANLIKGMSDGTLSPRGEATREQFATILKRFDETFTLVYNEPVLRSHYTEREYPLVEDADIYVSVTGDDSAPGTKSAPIRTFSRAVEMVRDLKGTKNGSVVVAFFAGCYDDTEVTMTAEDSGTKDAPVIYCAYGDGEVILSGGVVISRDSFADLTDEDKTALNFAQRASEKIKKADMNGIISGFDIENDVLFNENGVMAVARVPNKFSDGSDSLMHAGLTTDNNHIRINSDFFKRRIAKYHTTDGLYLYGYLTTGWYKDLLLTDGYTFDAESGGFDFLIPHPESAIFGYLRREPEFASEAYNKIAVVNVSEELDSKGEFFYDGSTSTLYVYDPTESYGIPRTDRCVSMDRTDWITFRGLTFSLFRDSMISGSYCHGITVDRCKITKCAGACAVDLEGCEPGRDFDITVSDSEFRVFACRAFRAKGCNIGANSFNGRGNVEVRNNLFAYTNLIDEGGPDGAAVTVTQVNAAHVCHNEFEHAARGAVSYCKSKNLLAEHNSLRDCMCNSTDGGVFYANESQEDWNNVIRYNVFYPSFGYAAYIDDNEPGTVMYGNLFFSTTGAVVHEGRSNVLNNNVLIKSDFTVTSGIREYVEEAKATGNLDAVSSHYYYRDWERFFDTLEANPEMKAGFEEYFPDVLKLSLDLEDIDSPLFVLNPVNEIHGNYFFEEKGKQHTEETITYEGSVKWCDIKDNRFLTLNENPIFVNPTLGDYRIREGVDFPDIEFEKAGRY